MLALSDCCVSPGWSLHLSGKCIVGVGNVLHSPCSASLREPTLVPFKRTGQAGGCCGVCACSLGGHAGALMSRSRPPAIQKAKVRVFLYHEFSPSLPPWLGLTPGPGLRLSSCPRRSPGHGPALARHRGSRAGLALPAGSWPTSGRLLPGRATAAVREVG